MSDTYESLSKAVDDDGGVHTAPMATLRLINGAARLGPIVCATISKELSKHGLGHIPVKLPESSNEDVRIFRLGTQIADVVAAVQAPSHEGDEVLRTVGGMASDKIARIKAIIDE
ncbi:hypothetical protein KGD82_13670 [Nocardiopsis eucommiae]|uniref:Uncharacterized protein n=1 Tax=Nocardiopsis eucommiae TaxID=2831970 RepID=A0A975QLZ4_9ACTN|nr:hypothetical protein KGD82_13670 [Nocardiopsis eucommiae]